MWSLEDAGGHAMMVRRRGAGAPLVWLHGMGDWSVTFDAILDDPRFAGHAHVLPDLPGYGRSPWPDAPDGLEALADRLAAWISARVAPRPVLIGHSLGGVLVTLLAERMAVRAVVAVDSNLSPGDCTFSGKAVGYTRDEFAARGFAAMRDQIYDAGRADRALRGYHAGLCAASPDTYHHHARELVALSALETLAPRLAAAPAPALYVAGVPDGICAHSRGLLDRHGVRWVGIAPAGHVVHVDQPDAFAAAVAGFLAGA